MDPFQPTYFENFGSPKVDPNSLDFLNQVFDVPVPSNTSPSSAEDEDLLAKKKAQNRAAQRAFRERKEQKMKQLEQQLLESENEKLELQRQVELLRKQNLEISTENKLLSHPVVPTPNGIPISYSQTGNGNIPTPVFPSEHEFFDRQVGNNPKHGPNPKRERLVYENAGDEVLTVTATWEWLQKESETVEFDVWQVMERLRGQEVCHGHGPAYQLKMVKEIVEEVKE